MTSFPSAAQLTKAAKIAEQIEEFQKELASIIGGEEASASVKKEPKVKKTRRTMSPEAKEKIAAAQRKRWAKSKRAQKADAQVG
ncbi:MAG TPA: hypothetical protein VGE29_16225 [Prosthecobacter sp.]